MIDILTGLVIGINVASVHAPALPEQNNFNPGLYVRHESGWGGGVYKNTLRRWSFWGGYTFEHGPFGLTVGGVTGYRRHTTYEVVPCGVVEVGARGGYVCSSTSTTGFSNGPVAPLIAPSVALPEVLGVVPRVTYMPKLGGASRSNAFHLSIERTF